MLQQDFRFASRLLKRAPSFALTAIAAVALGIGASAAIFSVVYHLLLRPLPFAEPARLASIWGVNPHFAAPMDRLPVTFADTVDFRDQSKSFDLIADYGPRSLNITGQGDPVRGFGIRVTGDFFQILGVPPFLGRVITRQDEQAGNTRLIVLSHAFWTAQFGANRDLVGQKIIVNDLPYTVIGVMPPGFAFPRAPDLSPIFGLAPETQMWIPVDLSAADKRSRGARVYAAIGRLRAGVSAAQARDEIAAISRRLTQYEPNQGFTETVIPLQEQIVGEIRRDVLVLFTAVGFVLLIACANVANLLLARSAARRSEMAIRIALGASRRDIVSQLLVESLLLWTIGGVAGVFLGYAMLQGLLAISSTNIPRISEVHLSPMVVLFSIAISLITGVLFGLAPALQGSRSDPIDALRPGDRALGTGGALRRAFIVSQVALAVLLLVGASLLFRSFAHLRQVPAGFSTDSLIAMEVSVTPARVANQDGLATFYSDILQRLRNIPGVLSAGAVSHLPLAREERIMALLIDGKKLEGSNDFQADTHMASPGYFETAGISLRRGRYFTEDDVRGKPLVAIINDAFASRYFPGEDPIGKRVTYNDDRNQWWTVVGVVGDVHHTSLETAPRVQVYRPFTQDLYIRTQYVVRTAGDPRAIVSAARKAVASVDPHQPVSKVRTLQEVRGAAQSGRKLNTALLGGFSALALLLTMIGLYGVVSYLATQRTREIGLRMALGAERSKIIGMMLREGALLTAIGLAIGISAALLLTRFLSKILFGVAPLDPLSFSVAIAVMLAVCILASYVPAARAARIDPLSALRHE